MAGARGPVTGAILAGGRGERLSGRRKALLPLGPEGGPLVASTVALLGRIADPVLVSVRSPEDLGAVALPSVTLVRDETPGLGPLGGLAAVLGASPHERCLVVACDMPSLSPALLEHLVALSFEHAGKTVVVPRTEAGLHPLHAVYARSLLPEIRARLARGSLALHQLLRATDTLEVAEEELRRYDPALRSLENVNTPEDLERARTRERGTP